MNKGEVLHVALEGFTLGEEKVLHRLAAPGEDVALRVGADQIDDAALADPGVEDDVQLGSLLELEREF